MHREHHQTADSPDPVRRECLPARGSIEAGIAVAELFRAGPCPSMPSSSSLHPSFRDFVRSSHDGDPSAQKTIPSN